jgi:ABC-type nitrate/sulfonate/bicarbonate transport system permease component
VTVAELRSGSTRTAGQTASPRRSPWSRYRLAFLRAGCLAFFLAVWEGSARVIGAIDIPGSVETLKSFTTLVVSPELWQALWVSNIALAAGFAGAAVVGVLGGLLIGRFRNADSFFRLWISILMITPMAMVIPMIIMALGFGYTARTLVVFIFVLPMTLVNTKAGVRTIPNDLFDMCRCFGGSERQLWRKIILPAAAPAIFTGLRIGLGRAVTGMIISEWLLAAVGLGSLLLQFRGAFDSGSMYALVLVILVESLILIQILRLVEHRVIGWTRRAVPGSK